MRALILCAGKGTRLGLKKTPKCMVKINGKPILEHLVNHLNKYGITEIIVNIHQDYEKIFKYFGTRLLYFYEPTLLGEAGTERMLQSWLGEEYIVMNGDTLTNVDVLEMSQSNLRVDGLMGFSSIEVLNGSVRFCKDGRYAGTKYVVEGMKSINWNGDGAYYFDCGTTKKLARARRFYARK